MFDDVVCRYPLPHHQDARFQTKDLAGFALGERWITGMLDDYEIALDGRPASTEPVAHWPGHRGAEATRSSR
jgi:hypothetical protein